MYMETTEMAKRTFVTFRADFPDESQWTENGSPLVPDGRSIAGTIASALRGAGFRVSEPKQRLFYGWTFEILFPKRTEWCLLQGGDPWLLMVEERASGWVGLFGARTISSDQDRALVAIDKVLKGDGRFSSVQWFTKEEYESGCRVGGDAPF
jgi:hypothetical protein